jgi:UDP-N-acetylglucosamine 2-epimerase (non-hydrolysing)
MTVKKIMLVFGTRPEAIKMAPLVKEFEKHPEIFSVIVCVTGQHREMLDQVLKIFDISPQHDLNIMKPGQDLYDITSSVLTGMRDVLQKEKPDLVFVHGDTTSSMATALAAFYQQIPVAHIEAGLRTYDKFSPYPEEMNRQFISKTATWHFAPTILAKQNLIREQVPEDTVCITGNTVIDALLWVLTKIKSSNKLEQSARKSLVEAGLPDKALNNKKLILITGHRRENFGSGFDAIFNAINELASKNSDCDFVYPVHLNPNVRSSVHAILQQNQQKNIYLIDPLEYLSFSYLMSLSYLILTDSGGIQEEAPSLGKPVLVLRNTTERPEAMEAGTAILVGTDKELIIREFSSLLQDRARYEKMSRISNPFGDGKACEKIVSFFL